MKEIKLNDKNLKIFYNNKYENANESNTYFAFYKDDKKIIKIFKDSFAIKNKVQKIELLKERLSSYEQIVTADCFITNKNKIIGYMMPYIKGDNLYYDYIPNKKDSILYLKELTKLLKRLHQLNIVSADFPSNTIITKDKKIYLIDHDNFSIDNYPIDLKNTYLHEYQRHIKTFDKNFDNYLLNIYTIAFLKHINLPYIYTLYEQNPFEFNFKDNEINEIFKNTMNLDKFYNEDLIIDKINCTKDLKKIKTKLF